METLLQGRLSAVTFHMAPPLEGSRRQRDTPGGGSLSPSVIFLIPRDDFLLPDVDASLLGIVGARLMARGILIWISAALIVGGVCLIGAELIWAPSVDIKFVLIVIVGGAAVTLGGALFLAEDFFR
jgi:hypothetical protein